MCDISTAAYCHGKSKNVKSSKSLFRSISFSGYFQQPAQQSSQQSSQQQPTQQQPTQQPTQQPIQQEVKLSPVVETISNDPVNPTSPIAPQQPTNPNKRSRERKAAQRQQQNSVSANIAATAPPRVVAANMGNTNSVQPYPKPSSTTPPSHHHTTPRRKKHSNKINRKKVDEAITLSAFAVEEDNQGNHDVAIGFYLSAIENMLEALPIHSNQARKDALKNKLREFMDREGLTDDFMETTNVPLPTEREKIGSSFIDTTGISDNIIQAAITSAVALKQSPIPDAISATVNYTMRKIQKIDEAYGLQDKAWEISRTGINMALEIDQQYNVHEKVGNALFTGLAAAMKAGIAYKDSPSYREIQRMRTDFQRAGNSNFKESSSSSSSSSSITN